MPAITVRKTIFFLFQMFWKNGLSKKVALEYDLSCIIRKDDDLNYGISPDRKAKMKKKFTQSSAHREN